MRMTMSIRSAFWFSTAVWACLFLPLRSYAQANSLPGPSLQGAESRASHDYPTVLERLLPVDPDPQSRRQKCKWRLVLRIRPDRDAEEQLVFERHYDGSIHLDVAQPERVSIRRQIEDLYSSHPSLSVDEVVPRVMVSRHNFGADRLPELRGWVEKLERATVPVVVQADLHLHGTTYQAWSFGGVESSSGDMNCWSMALVGPGSGAPKQPNSFIGLVEAIRRDIAKLAIQPSAAKPWR